MDELGKFLLTLLASALGGAFVAGLFGIYKDRVAKQDEREKWLREQKLEAYQKHLSSHDALMYAIGAEYGGLGSRDDVASAIKEAQSGLHILAPAAVYLPSKAMSQHLGMLAAQSLQGKFVDDQAALEARLVAYARLALAFAQAAREDLGIDSSEYLLAGSELSSSPEIPTDSRKS